MNNKKLNLAINLLRITYGLLFIIVGVDKFSYLITDWHKYVSPATLKTISIDIKTLLTGVGILEIILGIFILNPRWTTFTSYIASAWLVIIALNLIPLGIYYDIAARDVVMAIGSFALALLSGLKTNE